MPAPRGEHQQTGPYNARIVAARLDTTVTLGDGRRLAYTEWGTAAGSPILYFHGTPGSRTWCPDEAATIEADVRLIVPDRPGIGRSDPKERRTYGDWPADVVELADALGVTTFSVIGVSAGGPYAAACAALIPSRLTGVAIVSSRPLSRYDWEERPGIEATWDAGDQAEFELTRKDAVAAAKLAATNYAAYFADVEQHPEMIHAELEEAEGDRWFFAEVDRVAAFDASLRETSRQGMLAVAWELNTAYLPWGFRLANIPIPVRIWHGSQDPRVNAADIEFQISTIPRRSLTVWPDSGHLGFVKHWDEILATLT
jgi:pimeloyl-ACP methyl ester carboxylesterase